MVIEVEKKYRLGEGDAANITALLNDLNAVFQGEDAEENIIYGGGVLKEKNAVLRVRKIGQRTLLTYKLRLSGGGDIKRQIEEETEVADADAIERIIEELGFKPMLAYEKKRRIWNFRTVELVIDELPFGNFMEIEGSVTAIREAEFVLDIERLEAEQETYPSLTLRFGKYENGIVTARF